MPKYPEIELSIGQKGISYEEWRKPKIIIDMPLLEWLVINIGSGTTNPALFHRDENAKWCITTKRVKEIDKHFVRGWKHRVTAFRVIVKPGLDAQLLLFKLACGEK